MKKAFTLTELIIVIAVIGVLAAILIPVFANVIADANEKSALSDAKNAVTDLESAKNSDSLSFNDCVIIVYKAEKFYLYGYYSEDKRLMASLENPLEIENADAALLHGTVPVSGMDQEEISDSLNVPKTVRVFSGYTLQSLVESIELNKLNVAICAGDTDSVTANVKTWYNDNPPIIWKSDDESIATVENGVITGVANGETVITASLGNKTAKCNVTITDYMEFTGNWADLKGLIEDETKTSLLIKFMDEAQTSLVDYPDIFPIVIPPHKTVRMDINHVILAYSFTKRSNAVYALFVNNGGYVYFESTAFYRDGEVGYMADGSISGTPMGRLYENTNNGYTEVSENICFEVYAGNEMCAFENTSGTLVFRDGSVISYSNSEYKERYTVRNGKAGTVHISGGNFSGASIKNEGELYLSGGTLTGDVALENYGTLGISGGVIGAADDAFLCEVALLLKDGSTLSYITGGEFYGNPDVCITVESGAKVSNCVSGGKFSQSVPQKMLKQGYKCVLNKSHYEVVKE